MEYSNKRCTAIRRLNNELKKIDKKYIVEPLNTSEDNSFINFAAKIKKWKYNKLKFSKNTKYLLIFGDNNKEKYHMSMIPKQKNIKIIVLKNCDHNTALYLKKKGDLEKIINKFFNDNS